MKFALQPSRASCHFDGLVAAVVLITRSTVMWEKWDSTNTVRKITRNAIPEAQLLRARWVLTWKTIDAIEQQELGVSKKA